ncbi:hypothetical protein Dimus_026357 [Dionaea muscipula]
MSTASSSSDPNASDDLPNDASLVIMVLPPPETSSNPASNIPFSSNASPSGYVPVGYMPVGYVSVGRLHISSARTDKVEGGEATRLRDLEVNCSAGGEPSRTSEGGARRARLVVCDRQPCGRHGLWPDKGEEAGVLVANGQGARPCVRRARCPAMWPTREVPDEGRDLGNPGIPTGGWSFHPAFGEKSRWPTLGVVVVDDKRRRRVAHVLGVEEMWPTRGSFPTMGWCAVERGLLDMFMPVAGGDEPVADDDMRS